MSNDPYNLSRVIANAITARDRIETSVRPFYNTLSFIDSTINIRASIKSEAVALSYARQLEQVAKSFDAIAKSANSVNASYLASLARSVALVDEAIFPSLAVYQNQSATIEQALRLRERDLPAIASIGDSLREYLGSLNTSYILPEFPRASIFGFGRLTNLSNTIHTESPYASTVNETVAEEIGAGIDVETAEGLTDPLDRDTAAIEAGLQAELVAFPPSGYSQVLYEAKFQLSIPTAGIISASTRRTAPDTMPSAEYYELLIEVESHLRNLIVQRLFQIEGNKWIKRRVPEDIRKRWNERIGKERALRRNILRPIDYSDFADLMHIICRADNWREAFETVFNDKNELQVSFGRLMPVRNAIGHARPLGMSDILFLISESTRILSALGVLKLH